MPKSIFEEYAQEIPGKILEETQNICREKRLNTTQIKKILDRVKEAYTKAKINPGEGIGIVTAESIGEPATQMILWSFHFAGVSEMNVTVGLPRLIEIFDARKNPSTPRMTIYLKSKYSKDPKLVRKIAARIKETKLKEIAFEFSINFTKIQVEAKLDRKKMRELEITEDSLVKAISTSTKSTLVKIERDTLILKPKLKEFDLSEVYKIKEKAKYSYVSGVKGISQVLPIRKDSEFIITCAGTNLKDVLKIEEVDEKRTFTNDIMEIRSILGIEAARQAIINEALKVIEDQGLDVDIRHIMFLSDAMTVTGQIKGITRGGITSEKESVLARASFETPIKHIINASLIGERDNLNSVIENVILNQPVPLGTGLTGLVVKSKASK